MGSESEGEDQFFDTREDIASVSDSGSDGSENLDSESGGVVDSLAESVGYEVWVKNPGSIRERRNKFLKWMGVSVDREARVEIETSRISEHSGAVLRSSSLDDGFSSSQSSQSSMSCWSNDGIVEDNFVCRIRNLDDGSEFIVDELGQHGLLEKIREVGSNRLLTVAEFERNLGLSPLVQQMMAREVGEGSDLGAARKQIKTGWLRRLGVVACFAGRDVGTEGIKYVGPYQGARPRNQMVRVQSYKKRSKELSALYLRQDIPAHQGSILAMKFSPDGQYLASAGEDGIVCIWEVIESEISDEFSPLDMDPSRVYFKVNNLSEMIPLHVHRGKKGKTKSLVTMPDTACVIFPHKVFGISEKPIHEFYRHDGEVLDISWSKNKYLLSSSVDKTVRLWQVGCSQCLQVFSHTDYVTCIQFNPIDDSYFISGSIDGKVRIWDIPGCQVVDWTDAKEIVTTLCYHPDGKAAVVGSISGNCRFYDASDNCLEMNVQVSLQGKKKSPLKRITGFEFAPGDPSKLMVTSADSKIRMLHGVDVICKYQGLRATGNQITASFTSDGTHIVTASEDSNVYFWNLVSQGGTLPKAKKTRSCEHFFSNNVSVAIPWCGMTCQNTTSSSIFQRFSLSSTNVRQCNEESMSLNSESGEISQRKLPFSSPDHISLSHGLFPEALPKGAATWPEEKLPSTSMTVSPAMCKSEYKLLKMSYQSMHNSPHAWGLVIVTGGWDGRIRSFQNYGLPICP